MPCNRRTGGSPPGHVQYTSSTPSRATSPRVGSNRERLARRSFTTSGGEDANRPGELVGVEGLGEGRSRADGSRHLIDERNSADDDDRRLPACAPAVLRRELFAAHPGSQVEVEDDRIRVEVELGGELKCLLGVARHPYRELVAKRSRNGRKRVGIVLHHEDAHHLAHPTRHTSAPELVAYRASGPEY